MLLNSIPNTVYTTPYSPDLPSLSVSLGLGGFFPPQRSDHDRAGQDNNKLLVSNNG